MDFVCAESKYGVIEVENIEAKVEIDSGQLLARLPQQIKVRFTAGTENIEQASTQIVKINL